MAAKVKSERTGKSIDDAQPQRDQIEEILQRVDAMPALDRQSEDDILRYGGQFGLWMDA
jgi:hypothetical protein